MHYYLCDWAQVVDVDGQLSWQPAIRSGDWSALDLRPDPADSAGRCFVAVTERPIADPSSAVYLGESTVENLPGNTRNSLANALSLTLSARNLRDILLEVLTDHAREDGTRWRSLKPLSQGVNAWEIRLGGLVYAVPRIAGGASFTDDFTAADAILDVAGTDLTWTLVQQSNGWAVVSNECSASGSEYGFVTYARAEHDSGTADQFAEFTVTDLSVHADNQVGPVTRFDPAANTGYLAQITGGDVAVIRKTVAGSRTNLTGGVSYTRALPHLVRGESEGSTIRLLLDSTELVSVTDTSITGFTRAGMYAHRASGNIVVDNFGFGDLSSGGSQTKTVTDSVGVTDTTARSFSRDREQTDPVGITDAVVASWRRLRTVADSVGVTDTVARSFTRSEAIVDSIGIADTETEQAVRSRTVTDSVGITDDATASHGASVVTDPVGITDEVVTSWVRSRTVTDDVGVTDSLSTSGSGQKTHADPVGITDDVVAVFRRVAEIVDSVGLTDDAVRGFARSRSMVDGIGVTDTASRTMVLSRTVVDGIGILDRIPPEVIPFVPQVLTLHALPDILTLRALED